MTTQTASRPRPAPTPVKPEVRGSRAYTALISNPSTWDTPSVIGPAVAWPPDGAAEHPRPAKREEFGFSVGANIASSSRIVGAGDGFGYAVIDAVRYGPIYLSKLMVACCQGQPVFQYIGGAGGEPLYPHQRLRVENLTLETGLVEIEPDGSSTVTGLAVTGYDGALVRIGVVRVAANL